MIFLLTELYVESLKQNWHNLCIRNTASHCQVFHLQIAYAKHLSIVYRYMKKINQ